MTHTHLLSSLQTLQLLFVFDKKGRNTTVEKCCSCDCVVAALHTGGLELAERLITEEEEGGKNTLRLPTDSTTGCTCCYMSPGAQRLAFITLTHFSISASTVTAFYDAMETGHQHNPANR